MCVCVCVCVFMYTHIQNLLALLCSLIGRLADVWNIWYIYVCVYVYAYAYPESTCSSLQPHWATR